MPDKKEKIINMLKKINILKKKTGGEITLYERILKLKSGQGSGSVHMNMSNSEYKVIYMLFSLNSQSENHRFV